MLQVAAFDLQYLSRVVDVKDTVHKASLMLHLVELVVDKFPDSTDLYSELSHVHRIAKVKKPGKIVYLQLCSYIYFVSTLGM